MKKTISIVGVLVIIAVAAGFYWKLRMPVATPQKTATASATPTAAASGSTYVSGNLLLGQDSNNTLGAYLIAYNGMTLYTYAKDTPGQSNCTDACAANWPPYIVKTPDQLSNVQAGITGSVDTIPRDDGSLQVTYNGMPVYFYVQDKKSGDTNGQNVGGIWFVVKP